MTASHVTTPSAASGSPTPERSQKAADRTAVTAGPASAIRNSPSAEGKSPRKAATPPNSHSVMPSISIRSLRACIAWPSSWRRSDAKNVTEATTAMAA